MCEHSPLEFADMVIFDKDVNVHHGDIQVFSCPFRARASVTRHDVMGNGGSDNHIS